MKKGKSNATCTRRAFHTILIYFRRRRQPVLLSLLSIAVAWQVAYVVILLLNRKGVIAWYPLVELSRTLGNTCHYEIPTRAKQIPTRSINFPFYILHGRNDPVAQDILNALDQVRYTVYRPQYDATEQLSWECRVVWGHGDLLHHAFTENEQSQHVVVMEDDALLGNLTRLQESLQYYVYKRLPFLSLYDAGDVCTKYKSGTPAYVISRDFYDKSRCFKECQQTLPLDICLSSNHALEKVARPVFLHHAKKSSRTEIFRPALKGS
jgi:hypothetical protein|mmetsp:Transcript_20176/g.36631  ORF Transcript_20176/g.36631 Transcript_20176/m.36631 type:complete len:265 (-) Transcript_20176:648-1442(-)